MVPPSPEHVRDGPAPLDDAALERLAALARRLARAAGAAVLPHFRSPALVASDKGEHLFDPVTVADHAGEEAIRRLLALERPEDAVLGEEQGSRAGTNTLTWVIDPIDGTRSFISGVPTWGVLVALDDGTTGRIGVVAQPYIGELFMGVKGLERCEAWFERGAERRTLAVRACPGLEAASLFCTSMEMFDAEESEGFRRLEERARLVRFGTDCYAYALLAHGLIDLVVESNLGAYDIAAPKVLVEAAGGIVTDWSGNDCRWGGQVIAAGDARVHAEALELLAPFARQHG